MYKQVRFFLLLSMMLLIMPAAANLSTAAAQDGAQTISIQVTVQTAKDATGDGSIRETVYWQAYQRDRAIVIYNELKKLVKESNKSNSSEQDLQIESDEVLQRIGKGEQRKREDVYEFTQTNGLGEIRNYQLPEGYAIIFIDKLGKGIELFDLEGNPKPQKNEEGFYEVEIQGTNRIKETEIRGTYKGVTLEGGSGRSTRDKEIWNLSIFLPKGMAKPNSRLIIQPIAVNLETADTIDYCHPIVYEGAAYHETQDKRMGYHFLKNDSLGAFYKSNIVLTDSADMHINERVVYHKRKEDIEKHTKFKAAVFKYSLEDYHSPYMQRSYAGQYPEDPLKFIDFSVGMNPLDINYTDKRGRLYFKEEAVVKSIPINRDLAMRFEVGKSVLIRDSLNEAIRDSLVQELSLFKDNMQVIHFSGGASPDGQDVKNKQLARDRASAAAAEIARYLPPGLKPTPEPPIVYTWGDVLQEMEKRKFTDEAEAVRTIVEAGASGPADAMDGPMRNLPFYEEKVVPILEKMRNMKCSYNYVTSRPLSPTEVYNKFMAYKQTGALDSLMLLSNGDFYNLYNVLDSADQDILTNYAYKALTRQSNYADYPISAFIANRKAMLMNKLGTPDSTILQPFIQIDVENDTTRLVLNRIRRVGDDLIYMNMPGILQNQAVTYLQFGDDESVTKASQYANTLAKNLPEDEDIQKLVAVVNFVRFFPDEDGLSASDRALYEPAKQHVLNSAPNNRAILFTEIPSWGERPKAPALVRLMDDDDPKKWYMRGILYANQDSILKCRVDIVDLQEPKAVVVPGFEDFKILSEEEENELMAKGEFTVYQNRRTAYEEALKALTASEGKEEQAKRGKEFIPYYLAYFQHCFDLDPSYMQYYFTEGHVQTEIRQKYKYKIKNMELYRKLFNKYLAPMERRSSAVTAKPVTPQEEKVEQEMPREEEVEQETPRTETVEQETPQEEVDKQENEE